MKGKLLTLIALGTLMVGLPLAGETEFKDLTVRPDGTILFTAETGSPEYGKFATLFLTSIDADMKQLTYFPERIDFLSETGQLQIQNRFGIFRSNKQMNSIQAIDEFPGFEKTQEVATGKLFPVTSSPDGRFLLYMEPDGFVTSKLKMYDVVKKTTTLIAQTIETRLDIQPARWSPDSRYFIYATDGTLYYYSIDHYANERTIAPEFREIGPGFIENVQWSRSNHLYYIRENLVYKIGTQEFFTHSMYGGIFTTGVIVGKIPSHFDPNFDRFHVSPGGGKILLNKEGRNLFVFKMEGDDFSNTGGEVESLPYLLLPRNTRVVKVLWKQEDTLAVLTKSIQEGSLTHKIYRFIRTSSNTINQFSLTQDKGIREISMSPSGSTVALLESDSVIIKDYSSWQTKHSIKRENLLHISWASDDSIILAGRYTIELYDIPSQTDRVITVAQPEDQGVKKDNNDIQVRSDKTTFVYDEKNSRWNTGTIFDIAEKRTATESFRIYRENLADGPYRNLIMVRKTTEYGTYPLFEAPASTYDPFPKQEEAVDFTNFNHGSRTRRREISLVFNAIDSVEGLTDILNVLENYNIRASFFVNGEFINRNPGAVKEIINSGHEVGSLFYVYFDMTDSRFDIDNEFIKQGLARNEDLFYNATGMEVSLLWHAPYYFINSNIISASREMNYTYAGRDFDSLDWVSRYDRGKTNALFLSTRQIINRILDLKQPGSIIPVRIGIRSGGRQDYLFHRIDILINALINQGYDIVPVSILMEHAK